VPDEGVVINLNTPEEYKKPRGRSASLNLHFSLLNRKNTRMDLASLGFYGWFQSRRDEVLEKDYTRRPRDRGKPPTTTSCAARGRMSWPSSRNFSYAAISPEDFPVVGDWAAVRYYNEGALAIIRRLFPAGLC